MPKESVSRKALFDPKETGLFALSRSKLELFLQCPRCFYLDRRLGISRPDLFLPTLNLAVDTLLKREFDSYRVKKEPHPTMVKYGVPAVPYAGPEVEGWQSITSGIEAVVEADQLLLWGAIDDVWIDDREELIVVDYKGISTPQSPGSVAHASYFRQLEVYQWILKKAGFRVSDLSILLFANADRERPALDNALQFHLSITEHRGSTDWVPDAVHEAVMCLRRETPPTAGKDCAWCSYRDTQKGHVA